MKYEALWNRLLRENKNALLRHQRNGLDLSKPLRLSFRVKFSDRDSANALSKSIQKNYELVKPERIVLRTKQKPKYEVTVCLDTKIIPTARAVADREFMMRIYSEGLNPLKQEWVFVAPKLVAQTPKPNLRHS